MDKCSVNPTLLLVMLVFLVACTPERTLWMHFGVDEICDFNEDVLLAISPTFREKDAEKRKAIREDLAATKLPEMLTILESRLVASNGPWFLDSISLADLSIYNTVTMFKSGWLDDIPTDLCDKFNKIMAVYDAVSKHPNVIAYNAGQKK
ncbi:hypothetical protein AC1031_012140 [Aphanomyces cochlioides]|nr:hypothetical protein AC1031_012140 [Aphanomyces cochlioides]